MALFKKKITYTDYVGNFVAGLIQAGHMDLKIADSENDLTDKELKKIDDALLPFSLAITLLELLNTAHSGKNPTIPANSKPEEVNYLVSKHMCVLILDICKQLGYEEQFGENLTNEIIYYLDILDSASEDDLKNGSDFLLTFKFANHVLGKAKYGTDKQTSRNFVVFDIPRQVCKNTQRAYRQYAKDFSITP